MKLKEGVIMLMLCGGCILFVAPATDLEPKEISPNVIANPVPIGWPVKGRISSDYGMRRHPIWRRKIFHDGLDIKAPYASVVRVTAAGKIEKAGFRGGYGRCVIVDHGFGWKSVYAHLKSVAVKAGERVLKGQKIGMVGSSGRATGPHLHYEVLYKSIAFNPELFTAGFDRQVISLLEDFSQKGSFRPR
ncbi:MAG: M23 family metallopeptidase [Deltaproteobacteria bacterium]|nr:M23 family metallopeptidase [Deltaproteobacteria bacterium]